MLENLLRYKLWKEIIGDIIGAVLLLTPFVIIGFILVLYKINEYKSNKEMLRRNREIHREIHSEFIILSNIENIKNLAKIIDFLKHEFPKGIQMFCSKNKADDYMYNMYSNDDVIINNCYQYNYIEISGLTIKEFDIVCKAVNKHHWLKRKFSD